MNCKKTWFGYLNFILGALLFSASVITLVYLNLEYKVADYLKEPKSGLSNSTLNIEPWLALLYGVLSLIAVIGIFVLLRKFREYLHRKTSAFSTDLASEIVGGLLSFGVFAAGLFLRIKMCINADLDGLDKHVSVNLSHSKALFENGNSWDFSSFDGFYDSVIAFIYKFTGIKTSTYIWLNLVLQTLILLFVYCVVRNVFNSLVSAFTVSLLALTPDYIKEVIDGGYGNFEVLLCALLLLIFTGLIPLLSELEHYDIVNLILTIVGEILFICVLPILFIFEQFKMPNFSESISVKISAFSFPFNIDGIVFAIIILCLIACISFVFSNQDRISLIFPVFALCTFFYITAGNKWPSAMLIGLLICTFAGIGFDETFFSRIPNKETAETTDVSKTLEGVTKPEINDIATSENPSETENNLYDNSAEDIEAVSENDSTEKTDIPSSNDSVNEAYISSSGISADEADTTSSNESDKEADISSSVDSVEETDITSSSVSAEEDESISESDSVEEDNANSENDITVEEDKAISQNDITVEKENNSETTGSVSYSNDDINGTEEPDIILFESPLPLPKKKAKKEINYALEPDEDKMSFDIDIEEDDDFDV